MTDDDDLPSFLEKQPRARRSAAAIHKLIDDRRRRRMARLAPALAALGLKCENVAGSLREFLDFENRGVEVALPELLGTLRRDEVGVLTMIADMLDPDKPGPWKLELRRNVRGTPSDRYGGYDHWIALEYFELFEELEAQGVRSPAKETTRRLIEKWKWSDNDIRRAVQWWRKRGLSLKR
jgi:hypothetical protein